MRVLVFLIFLGIGLLCVSGARAECVCPETNRALSQQTLMDAALIAHAVLFGAEEVDGQTHTLVHIGGIYYQRDPDLRVGQTLRVLSDEHSCNLLAQRPGVDGEKWNGDIVLYGLPDGRYHYRSQCDERAIMGGEWQTLRAGHLKKKRRPDAGIALSDDMDAAASACGGESVQANMSLPQAQDCAVPEELPRGGL